MFWARKQYYKIAERLSSIETIQNYTGFGLYDRKVVDLVRSFDDPYPYFRGMIAEIGLPTVKLLYDQPSRKFGITKNNWYTLYDIGMLGIINHSKVPLRLATFAGFIGAAISFLIAFVYLILKLVSWSTFEFGLAPMLIGVFFIASLQLVFLGVMGEYVGAIYTQVQKRPYAVELERINFDKGFGWPTPAPSSSRSPPSASPHPVTYPPPPSTSPQPVLLVVIPKGSASPSLCATRLTSQPPGDPPHERPRHQAAPAVHRHHAKGARRRQPSTPPSSRPASSPQRP